MINKLKKQLLRNELLNKRKLLSNKAILDKSNQIANRLKKFDKYQQSEKIMLYISTKYEVQTQNIIESAQKDNKKLYIPIIIKEKHDLIPSLVNDFNKELALGDLGIYQPKEEHTREIHPNMLDMVIIPGIGFTTNGNRLGRGGGYYDRFLKKLKENCRSVALAFEIQIVEEIPLDEYDVPVDYIITEDRIIKIKQE